MYILLVLLALSSVSTHDINVGSSTGGKKVFDEHFQASPAVWRQAQNVTINTTDDEVINRIVVTDLREDKDGDAKIVDGGEGQKKVTIELKSPTVLRGYDFNVEVYAAPNKDYQTQKNGPVYPGQFVSNAGSLNTHYPASKITPQGGADLTTKLPEIPKTQTNPTNAEAKQNNARETRDTEEKTPEVIRPKIESPSIFGQKAATTTKPGTKDNNVPVTIGTRQFNEDTEVEDRTTSNLTVQTNKDEVRHVRDTHEDQATTTDQPKHGSFNSKTTTTTNKTPSYINIPVASHPIFVANEARDVRATQKDEAENVSPSLISRQRNLNPTVYTPNFEGNIPSLINSETNKDKHAKDQSQNVNDKKRNIRETQVETKEKNTPNVGLPNVATVNKRAENVNNEERRKMRSAQEGSTITPLNVDIKEVTSTTASSILSENEKTSDSGTDNQSSLKPPGILNKSQNYPAPYPYEDTIKAGSTTKTPFKRDTESQEPQKQNDKLNPKPFGSFETTTKVSSTTKSPVKRDTESSEEPKADDKNTKINPKSFGSFETTTTKVSSTTKSPVKRDTETSEKFKADNENAKINPKSFGSFETTTKVSSTTKSPVKRDAESSEELNADDKTFNVPPKSIGSPNTTSQSHDHKVPVVSIQ